MTSFCYAVFTNCKIKLRGRRFTEGLVLTCPGVAGLWLCQNDCQTHLESRLTQPVNLGAGLVMFHLKAIDFSFGLKTKCTDQSP